MINAAGRDIVKRSEGLRFVAYLDPVGIWTIGYGHTKGVTQGMVIDLATAERFLDDDLADASAIVARAVKPALNENQFSALTSFVFNVGPGRVGVKDGFVTLKNGNPSTMLRKLNLSDFAGAADEFPRWVHGGGVALPGLVKRRAEERNLFLTVHGC